MLARATLAMVTFLSWMANVRTSFFTVRIPVWNRSGLTLRSVGSGSILLPAHCGLGWYVACQRVRRVLLLLFGEWRMGGFSTFGVLWELLGVLCVWEMLVLLVLSLIFTGLGLRRCAFRRTRFLGGGRREHYLRDSWGVSWITQKVLLCFDGREVIPENNAVYASLGGTAQSPWP